MSFLSDLGSLQRQLESSFQTMFGGMRSFSPANTQFDGVSENSTALAVSGGIGGVGGGGWIAEASAGGSGDAIRVLDPSAGAGGQRFKADFELIGEIGRGGFGTVLSARHRIDGRMYAVKRIRIKRVGLGGFMGGRVARALQKRFVLIMIVFIHRYDYTFVVPRT